MGGPAFSSEEVCYVIDFAIWYGGLLETTSMNVSTVNMFEMFNNAGTVPTLVHNTPWKLFNVDVVMNARDVREGGEHVGHSGAWVWFNAMHVEVEQGGAFNVNERAGAGWLGPWVDVAVTWVRKGSEQMRVR